MQCALTGVMTSANNVGLSVFTSFFQITMTAFKLIGGLLLVDCLSLLVDC